MTWHLVTPEHPPRVGGIATWVDRVAGALVARGHAVQVHARGPCGERPWPVRSMPGRAWARWGGAWAALAVAPRLRRGDVLLCATWEMAWGPMGGLLARAESLGVPALVAWHGSDLTRPPVRPGRDEVARRARNVTVSRFLAGTLLRETGARATVLPAPIDRLAPVAQGPRWLVVARLVPTKGVDTALRLAAAEGRAVTVVGDGPARDELERLAATLAIDVRFLGALPHERIPWAGHDTVVLTPRAHPDGGGAEGLGMVLLEGAARGLRTLGNDVGGVPEAAATDPRTLWPHGSERCVAVLEAVAHGMAHGAPAEDAKTAGHPT